MTLKYNPESVEVDKYSTKGFNPLMLGFEEISRDVFRSAENVGTYLSDKIKNYCFRGE